MATHRTVPMTIAVSVIIDGKHLSYGCLPRSHHTATTQRNT